MRVAVGGIVHARWTIPAYREALLRLDAGPHTIVWAFVTDGDVSLSPFQASVIMPDFPSQQYCRAPGEPMTLRRTYERLAFLRNTLAQLVLAQDCEALLSIDSDVLVPPDLLVRLADADRHWVSALVRNSATDPHCWNVFHYREGLVQHFTPAGVGAAGREWPAMQPWDYDPRDAKAVCDLAGGAVTLYSRELLLRARWHSNLRGHQEDLGFAEDAFAAGYRASYLPIVCKHLTVDGIGHE